jgi:hypothetical protein
MKLISTPPTRPREPTSSHLRETSASAPTPAEAVGTRGRPRGEQSPENVSTRREASAVCPRRRERTGRRAERGSPTGHDIGQPSAVSTGAVPPRDAARGRGTGGDLKRVAPAAEPPKYCAPSNYRAIRRSTREIMVEAPKFGMAACDWRPSSRFENLERAVGGEPPTRSIKGEQYSPT